MTTSTSILSICVIAPLWFGTAASAQDAAPRVGLGVTISDVGQALVTASSGSGQTSGLVSGILVPIRLTPQFRLEPEVGAYRNASTDSQGPADQTTTSVRIGVGGFGVTPVQRVTISYGARIGYLRSITTLNTPAGTIRTDAPGFFVAPAAGGDSYFLADHLSVGAEVQLKFSSWKWTDSGSNRSEQSVATIGALVVRFYFP